MNRILHRRKKLRSETAKRMVKARNEKRSSIFGAMRVVGTIETSGCMGNHTIELKHGDAYSEDFLAVVVDGEQRSPRSALGVWKCLKVLIWNNVSRAKAAARRFPVPEYMI